MSLPLPPQSSESKERYSPTLSTIMYFRTEKKSSFILCQGFQLYLFLAKVKYFFYAICTLYSTQINLRHVKVDILNITITIQREFATSKGFAQGVGEGDLDLSRLVELQPSFRQCDGNIRSLHARGKMGKI